MAKEFIIKQLKSTIGATKRQKDGLRCLGLRGINSENTVANNPAMKGQIFRLQKFLQVTPVK